MTVRSAVISFNKNQHIFIKVEDLPPDFVWPTDPEEKRLLLTVGAEVGTGDLDKLCSALDIRCLNSLPAYETGDTYPSTYHKRSAKSKP